MKKITKCISTVLLAACLLLSSACSIVPVSIDRSQLENSSSTEENSKKEEESKSEEEEKEPQNSITESENEEVPFDGVWETSKVKIDGEECSPEQIREEGMLTTLILYPSGNLSMENGNVYRQGTWSQENGKVQLQADGFTLEIECIDGQLIMISEENVGTIEMTLDRVGDAPKEEEEPEQTGTDAIVGVWELDSIELDEDEFTEEEIKDAKENMQAYNIRFDIREDGTFEASQMDGEDTLDTFSGEWHQSGDDYILEVDGEAETFRLSGDSLLAEDNSTTLIFKKK